MQASILDSLFAKSRAGTRNLDENKTCLSGFARLMIGASQFSNACDHLRKY